jgi:hypothetical protein
MTTYNPRTRWTLRIVFVAATIAVGIGALQLVAGAMTHPDPETMAVRQQVIAAEAERAQQIRDLQQGEVRMAKAESRTRF